MRIVWVCVDVCGWFYQQNNIFNQNILLENIEMQKCCGIKEINKDFVLENSKYINFILAYKEIISIYT